MKTMFAIPFALSAALFAGAASAQDFKAELDLAVEVGKEHIQAQVNGTFKGGLAAILFGTEELRSTPLPNGLILELDVLGVFAWGETGKSSMDVSVHYEAGSAAGLKFRMQAFALAPLTDAGAQPGDLRASRSVLIRMPDVDNR